MLVWARPTESASGIAVGSNASEWTALARDLLFAIDRLESINRKSALATISRNLLLSVAKDMQSISIMWCNDCGAPLAEVDQSVQLDFRPVPVTTDWPRDDGTNSPNASIDRAISKAGAKMLSWTKDPETFDLIEHQRYKLFLSWAEGIPVIVNEYAYGIFDGW